MLDREPGPLALVPLDALRPLPPRPSFEALIAGGVANTIGADGALSAAASTIADGATEPADNFDGELAEALSDALEMPGADAFDTLVGFAAHGDGLDGIRAAVADVLPDAGGAVDLDFSEPPQPPVFGAGQQASPATKDDVGEDFIP